MSNHIQVDNLINAQGKELKLTNVFTNFVLTEFYNIEKKI